MIETCVSSMPVHSPPTVPGEPSISPEIDTATIRLHWTDQPYKWHVNDGPEVFVVLDGAVDMHYRENGEERVERLTPGRICYAQVGDEHVAHPAPEVRILVVERKGSV
ncbi:cupin [Nocardia jiangxiensis]|uniref:cupin n=1 Tax=Nocardia jiangxiensis TaxID=282685 RepID=UPI0002D75BB1|nr:cupin [Nocardia jiangxiensis]